MKSITKINRIKIGLVITYFLSLFLPVYSEALNGKVYSTSISKVGAGTFFVIYFAVLVFTTIILYFINKKYHKIAYLVTSGFMVLLLLILAFFKQDGSTLHFAFYLQFIVVGLFFLSFFKDELTVKIFDTIIKKTIHYIRTTIRFVKKKIKTLKENKGKKNTEKQDLNTESIDNTEEEKEITA